MNGSKQRSFVSKVTFGLLLSALLFSRGIAVQATGPAPEETRKLDSPNGARHVQQDALLANMAKQLHNEAFSQFIRANGNGFSRTIRMMPTKKERLWFTPVWTSEELAKEQPPLKEANDLGLIHRLGLARFADSNAAKIRDAGSAKEISPANKQSQWEIKALDLVGLVMHETPVVYMSATLPEMKELKKKTTRALDVFESEGLEELATGKDLYVRSKADTIRVLGPIHAGKACLKCHAGAKEGDLLGAFSYTLRTAEYKK